MPAEPLISCLMVVMPIPGRFERLKQSLDGYRRQTHARRELVMVVHGRRAAGNTAVIKAYVAALGDASIRVLEPTGDLTLGALRNLCLAEARGEVFCQWDDDDLHHPERLAQQLAAMEGEAVGLQEVLHLHTDERWLCCLNWRGVDSGVFPASLMWRADTGVQYPEATPTALAGEGAELSVQLERRDGLKALAGAPHLYVYVFHGLNGLGALHHRLLDARIGLSQGLLRRREPVLRDGLAPLEFGAEPVTVMGGNGPAFVIG